MDYIIKNKKSILFYIDQQHLIYVKGEKGVGKSKIIKTIEMKFILLGRSKKLAIFAPTIFAVNSVDKNTVYTALRVNDRIKKNYQVKSSTQ